MRSAYSAAPSAHPASPGAGGTNTRSNPESARRRALATPLSATPPPKHRSLSAVPRAPDQLPDLLGHGRTAVGGKPHHLVLVLVHRESEIRGKGRIQHAERV